MAMLMLDNIRVKENILADEKYKYAFSVEEVNKLVLSGVPFRDAYKQIGMDIEEGKFTYSTALNHVHEGSIGNLCNDKITGMMREAIDGFGFEKVHRAVDTLIKG